MSEVIRRRFGRAFKLEVVRRMAAGESGTALSREGSSRRSCTVGVMRFRRARGKI